MLKKRFFKTKDECEVTFEFAGNDVQAVALVGDFNEWQPVPMKKARAKGSPFRIKVRLPKNKDFQFRYFIDQQDWSNEEAADDYWPNEFGETNSVVHTFNGAV